MTLLLLGFGILFTLLFLGVPIAYAMGLVGVVGFGLVVGWQPALHMVGQVATDAALNPTFSVIPLFVLMGNLISHSRIAGELYDAAYAFLGHRRGGLAMATIAGSGSFAAVSGSSIACAATMVNIAVPPMKKYGYNAGFAAASVAAGGTLGILIPPSIGMVIYALITEMPLGKLLIAGIIPGVLTVIIYILAISVLMRYRPEYGPPGEKLSWTRRIYSLRHVWPVALLFLMVLGGIYFGIFTPTEAAGIGAFGAFIISLARKAFNLSQLFYLVLKTIQTSAMLFVILVGALLFANFVTVAGLPNMLETWISQLNISPTLVLLQILLVYLVMGCIMESTGLVLLTVPIFFPVIVSLGIDPIWFGIFVLVAVEVGLITPPIGMNVFVVKSMLPDVSVTSIYKGIIPFLSGDVLRISLFMLFPQIVLFLPELMK